MENCCFLSTKEYIGTRATSLLSVCLHQWCVVHVCVWLRGSTIFSSKTLAVHEFFSAAKSWRMNEASLRVRHFLPNRCYPSKLTLQLRYFGKRWLAILVKRPLETCLFINLYLLILGINYVNNAKNE